MRDFLVANPYFFLLLTFALFALWRFLEQKTHCALFNPILFSAASVIGLLLLLDIPYGTYEKGCSPFQYLMTPATICFAVSMYEQIGKLKKHLPAIVIGVLSGTVVSIVSIALMCRLFGLDGVLTASLLPKSITAAIGMVLSDEAGGVAAITTTAILTTGCLGNIFAGILCRLFRFRDPVVQGVAIGTASHAIGTGKAFEMSEVAGATSSLALTFAGLITVVLFSFMI